MVPERRTSFGAISVKDRFITSFPGLSIYLEKILNFENNRIRQKIEV